MLFLTMMFFDCPTYIPASDDPNYYPHPRRIQVHNNTYGPGGFDPDINTEEASNEWKYPNNL